MTDSSSELRKLLEADRIISAPNAADRRRNRQALAKQIGLGALVSASVATTSSWGARVASSVLVKWTSALVLVGASSGTAVWLAAREPGPSVNAAAAGPSAKERRGEKPQQPGDSPDQASEEPAEPAALPAAPAVVSQSLVVPASELPVKKNLPTAEIARPSAGGPSASAAEFPSDSSDLNAEAKLLSQVRGAMRAGNPRHALALLDEGRARFQAGSLHEESAATRVFALCQVGRGAEARAAAASFVRRFPRSLLGARVSSACASDPSR